ncbi:MAG TPA: hypothetical protein VK439_16375, partial [Rubrivivax sp.]|nr:hypothetical protein [Rubrivivax sp.]
MTPHRSHASADSYDPFEDTRGPVSQALHFEVERIPGAAPGEPARFRKTIKPGVGDELLRMIHRENMLLMDMAAHRLTHVAQSLEFSRSSSAVPFVVTTLDAGPSLNLWQRHHFARLGDAAAPARSLLAPSAFARLLQQLLMALREFHAAGFVHCDIHAGNICLPFDRHPTAARAVRPLYEQLRLIDFGHTLSARLRLEAPLCLDPDAAESLRRVSPAFRAALRADTASGRPDEVGKLDFRLDLHALGALAAQWLGAVDWASEPQAVAQQPALAGCVAQLLAQDCDGAAPQPGLHERLLGPIDDIVRRLGVPSADWLLPQRLGRQQAAASAAGAQEARETPLIVARPTPIALPTAGRADEHAAPATAAGPARAPGSTAAPASAAASVSASAAPSAREFGGGPAAAGPTFTAASPAAPAGSEAARGATATASRIPARSHLVLWSLVAAALAAGAWAISNLGGTDPQPAPRTAARAPAPAKAVVATRPPTAGTNPLPDTLPAAAPGVALTPRQLEEHLDLMMNSAASGAWAEVEAVARKIATAAGPPPSQP